MSKKTSYIALLYLLVATLVFNQVGINFFHDRHDAHENTVKLPAGKASVQKHGEHCKVCALDLLSHYYLPSFSSFYYSTYEQASVAVASFDLQFASVSFAQDRAPPFFI